jgi:hypothetical protein
MGTKARLVGLAVRVTGLVIARPRILPDREILSRLKVNVAPLITIPVDLWAIVASPISTV